MLQILRPLPMPVAAFGGAALAPIVITSSATFSVAENSTAVATLTATGGTGSFTWTKIGGADTAKFTLSGAVLTFASAPDFETPTDANTDNVYLVQVQAADGVSPPATQNISVTVTDVAVTTTFNPSDKTANITLSAGNLQVASNSGGDGAVRTVASETTRKFYFEVKWPTATGSAGQDGAGIATAATSLSSSLPGNATGGLIVFVSNGNIFYNGSSVGISLGAFANNDVACFAVDLANLRAWARKNGGNWNNSGTADPATNIGGINISTVFALAAAYGAVTKNTVGPVALGNFGATAFAQTVPSGFSAGPANVAELWTPAQLTTLKGWYKANDLVGSDLSQITASWPDASGLGNHATPNSVAGKDKPRLQTAEQNGLNVVEFGGGGPTTYGQWFALPNLLSGASACAAILVLQPTASGDPYGGPLKIGSDVSANGNNHYPYTDANVYDDWGSSVRKTVSGAGTLVNTWHVASFHSAASNWKYYKNGTQIFATATNTVGLRTTPVIGKGARSSDTDPNYYGGMIGEIIIVNEFLSDADRQKAEGYLAHKWGLAGSLPGGHPYKSTPP